MPRPRPLLAVSLVLGAVVLLVLVGRRGPRVSQPVAFNHVKHTRDLKLGCEFCHPYVGSGAHAGLPDAQLCGACHQVPQGKSAEAARLTSLLSAGASLRFNKLFRLPRHVNFTHRRHVGIAQLACSRCHGAIADTDRPPIRTLVRVNMKFCLSCHRSRGQSLDCVACHR